jgi:PTH1 family peptidyl-tRNA hydrolase
VWLVAGLGNPGPKYAANRHNIGFMVIDEIARLVGAGGFAAKLGGEMASCELGGKRAVLLKPMEFINLSGHAVQRVSAFYQIPAEEILVIHDEIDLPLGTLRCKVGGGHGGHNGLRSIHQELASSAYIRIRCGVGKPAAGPGKDVASHVLGDFARGERTLAEILVKEASDCARAVLEKGPVFAMNTYNNRALPPG